MRRVVAAVAAAVLLCAGCGYDDGNGEAAEIVAQALLDAQRAGDADGVCIVLGPLLEAAAASQAGGSCPNYVRRSFDQNLPPLRVQRVDGDDSRLRATVAGRPDIVIGLIKYGSIWRVEEASLLTQG